MQRAYELTKDAALQDQLSVLGERLIAYYLEEAKRHLDRPDGSGANIGWKYLEEARQFRAWNLNAVLDEMTRARAAHQLRSRLSLRVSFRDQTWRLCSPADRCAGHRA